MAIMLGIGALLLSCVSSHDNNVAGVAQTAEQPPLNGQRDVPWEEAAAPDDPDESDGGPGEFDSDADEFDPKNPPLDIYTATKLDIQDYVRRLDVLIKAQNYEEWVKLLSKSYYELINSQEFLGAVSQQPRLKARNIVLRDSKDYFLNVVVASRSNLWVNDIEFVTLTKVMALTINQYGQRVLIYTLAKTPDGWEITE
jgi:hypothetical protein